MIDVFPADQQPQIVVQLAQNLQAVISQRLCRRADGTGRVPALEIMINSPSIKKYIEEGQTGSIHKMIEQSVTHYRMQTLNQHLVHLCKKGFISFEEGMASSNNPDEFKLNYRGIFASGAGGQPAGGQPQS